MSRLLCLVPGIFACSQVCSAAKIPVNLSTFEVDPTVEVAKNGSKAVLRESNALSTVLLSSDPYFSADGVKVPSDLRAITVDYVFETGASGERNSFYAIAFDGVTGREIGRFRASEAGSGRLSFDVSRLPASVTRIGLEFQLNSFTDDNGLNSELTVANVALVTAAVPPSRNSARVIPIILKLLSEQE